MPLIILLISLLAIGVNPVLSVTLTILTYAAFIVWSVSISVRTAERNERRKKRHAKK